MVEPYRMLMLRHCSTLPDGALNGAHDARIGSAAANIRTHVRDDLLARRLRVDVEQIDRAHDLS
jgi:hypothetical protein